MLTYSKTICFASVLAAALILSACGGGSATPPAALSLSASQPQTSAAGDAIVLNASLSGASDTISWQLGQGSPGSLDKNSGTSVRYLPPAAGSIQNDSNVTVTATAGGLSQKISLILHPSAGAYLIAGTLGGSGNLDGTGTEARFNYPRGLALDSDNNLYISDYSNNLIRKMTPDGLVSTVTGNGPGHRDGPKSIAQLYVPGAISADDAGNTVFITDYGLRKASPDGTLQTLTQDVSTYSSAGPLARDSHGNLYTCNRYSKEVVLSKIDQNGNVSVVPAPASVSSSGVYACSGLAIDRQDRFYLIKSRECTISRIEADGTLATLAGGACMPPKDGLGTQASFGYPTKMTTDGAGNVYIYDLYMPPYTSDPSHEQNYYIRKLAPSGQVTTVKDISSLFPDATSALVQIPDARSFGDLVADPAGNLYFSVEHAIYKLSASGTLALIAGMPANYKGIMDGDANHASFDTPADMARDDAGNLYVLESLTAPPPCCYVRGLVLRKITPGGEVTTLAGPGTWWGKSDTANTALQFNVPTKIALDKQGNFYIIDYSPAVLGTSTGTIKKITAAGEVSTIAGPVSGGYNAMQTDSKGNLYFTDAAKLYVLSTQGRQSILYEGVGATISAITVTETGDIYLAGENYILKIDARGNLLSSGIYPLGIASDGQGGVLSGIARDKTGALFIATSGGAVCRVGADGKLAIVAGLFGQQGSRLGASSRLKAPTGLLALDDGTLAVISGQAILKLVVPK